MKLLLSNITRVINARIIRGSVEHHIVRRIFIDSRDYPPAEESLFIAISGKRHNAARFIPQLAERGFTMFITDEDVPGLPDDANITILRVDHSLKALQALAAYYRSMHKGTLIAITGSNGKTIVKEWIYQLVQAHYSAYRSPRSYNSQVGVPLSIFGLEPEHQVAIMEAGISQPGEMEKLEAMLQPATGLFTNLGSAHDEGFTSKQQKLEEKALLFKNCSQLIYCADHMDVSHFFAPAWRGRGAYTWTVEAAEEADVWYESLHAGQGGSIQKLGSLHTKSYPKNTNTWKATSSRITFEFSLPFTDPILVENALHAITYCILLGLPPETIAKGAAELESLPMRLELKWIRQGNMLVNDSYNSDVKSLEIALHFMMQHHALPHSMLILSDVLQSGLPDDELYRRIAELIAAAGINQVITVGQYSHQLAGNLNLETISHRHFPDTEALLDDPLPDSISNTGILLKGARQFAFERVARILEQRRHDTLLEINLEHLVHNFNVYRTAAGSRVKTMAMLKASAYGTGSGEIARVLQHEQADHLAVAYADEGVQLRRAGIHLPIVVLQAQPAIFDILLQHSLEPEIYDISQLKWWIEAVREHRPNKAPGIHLKVDTGMHRLGFPYHSPDELKTLLRDNPKIGVRSIFTHLSGADNPEHRSFTLQQISRFRKVYGELCDVLGYRPLSHMLNSSGMAVYPEASEDMVRIGIGLYGFDPSGNIQHELLPVVTFKARILQIKQVPAGEPIGYDLKGISDKVRTIAVISAGYADGIPRTLSNGKGGVYIQGWYAPFAGTICMDVSMADISHIHGVMTGDEVEIFGGMQSIKDVAEKARMIPYELLTSISPRVRRVFFRG